MIAAAGPTAEACRLLKAGPAAPSMPAAEKNEAAEPRAAAPGRIVMTALSLRRCARLLAAQHAAAVLIAAGPALGIDDDPCRPDL